MHKNILVVDDDRVSIEFFRKVLSHTEYTYDTSDNAKTASELLENNSYDILLTDKNMPGLDSKGNEGGMELLKYARKKFPEITVIMMTAFSTIETSIEAMKNGAFDYITKPSPENKILHLLERAFEYKQFINPADTMNIYKNLHDEILEILKESNCDDEKSHQLLRAIDLKIDLFFKTQKNWEMAIIEQRDALARIKDHAQILKSKTDDEETIKLIDKIISESMRSI